MIAGLSNPQNLMYKQARLGVAAGPCRRIIMAHYGLLTLPGNNPSIIMDVCVSSRPLCNSDRAVLRSKTVSLSLQHPRQSTAFRRFAVSAPAAASLTILCSIATPTSTQTAIANGDTRTINLFHAHRRDSISVTFRRDGSYDSGGLAQLNHFLRDWRNDQSTRMDPRLFDVIWEAQRGAGSSSVITVLSAYRSPTTNAMLRSRSRAVAKESQHMYGRAMDMRMADANMHRVREVALRLQRGGVGWYGSSNFVHLDVGSVRAWPRLSYDQLARLFPDGKSVHISADGRVLPGYEEARALVASRGGEYVPTLAQVKEKSFLARLFGWDEGDEAEARPAAPATVASARGARGARGRAPAASAPTQVAAYAPPPSPSEEASSAAAFFRADAARRSGGEAAPVQVASAPAPAPVRAAARPEPVKPETAKPETAKAETAKLEPDVAEKPARRAVEEQVASAPLPPRRPSAAQIAALVQKSEPSDVPMPPQRPESLTLVAEAKTVPAAAPEVPASEVPVPPVRVAAARAPGLPAVITRGTPVAASASALPAAVGLLAYAPTIQPSSEGTVRTAVPRKPGAARPTYSLAKMVGTRSAARAPEGVALVAARLDRSNFSGLTSGQRMSEQPVNSLMGSSVAPLRSAAKSDPTRLLFAPADAPSQGFTLSANPTRADRFAQPALRQASRGPEKNESSKAN